jgi:hypothetical protein
MVWPHRTAYPQSAADAIQNTARNTFHAAIGVTTALAANLQTA